MTEAKPSAIRGIMLIVRRELRQYFTTWSGYVITALMLLISGLLYNVFAIGSSPQYSSDVLAQFLYFQSGVTVVAALFFSMRLIAEERDKGTLPLLATSPLSDGQIIFAKFLSVILFLTIFLILTLPMPALIFLNGKVAISHIAVGYLGLLLIGSATCAIGVFGSALVSSQVVAIIISAVITVTLITLWYTARIADGWLSDVLEYLSLHNKHFLPFMDGTVSVTQVVFYLSMSAFFLVLARNALEAQRWRAS